MLRQHLQTFAFAAGHLQPMHSPAPGALVADGKEADAVAAVQAAQAAGGSSDIGEVELALLAGKTYATWRGHAADAVAVYDGLIEVRGAWGGGPSWGTALGCVQLLVLRHRGWVVRPAACVGRMLPAVHSASMSAAGTINTWFHLPLLPSPAAALPRGLPALPGQGPAAQGPGPRGRCNTLLHPGG